MTETSQRYIAYIISDLYAEPSGVKAGELSNLAGSFY